MATFTIVCDGPGPHIPADGVLGTSSVPPVPGMRCGSPSCVPSTATTIAAQLATADTIRTNLAAQVAPGSPARNAITTNTTFVGTASPTNAQVVAQVKALSNQNKVIIPNLLRALRLLLGQLDADA